MRLTPISFGQAKTASVPQAQAARTPAAAVSSPADTVRFGGVDPDHLAAARALSEQLEWLDLVQDANLSCGSMWFGPRDTGEFLPAVIMVTDDADRVIQAADTLVKEGLATRLASGADQNSFNSRYELLEFQGQRILLQHLPRPTYY